jgi:hypothetical protein
MLWRKSAEPEHRLLVAHPRHNPRQNFFKIIYSTCIARQFYGVCRFMREKLLKESADILIERPENLLDRAQQF